MAGDDKLWSDWGSGGDRALVSTSLPGQTTGGNGAVVVSDADASYPVPAGGESALSDDVLDVAAAAGESFLEQHDCPDPEGFQEELAKLPQEDIDLLGRVLGQLKAGDDPVDAVMKYERKATIHQVMRAKALVRQMPEEYRNWLFSFMGKAHE